MTRQSSSRLLNDYARWTAAPPRLSPASARTRVLSALASPAERRRGLRLASVGALPAVLAALLYGMHLAATVVANSPSAPKRAAWPHPAPRSRLLVVHTLSTGTPVYVFAAPARP